MDLGAWERRPEGGTGNGSPTGALATLTPGPEGLEGEHRVPFLGGLGLVCKRCWAWLAMSALASAEVVQDEGPGGGHEGGNEIMGSPHHGTFLGCPVPGVVSCQSLCGTTRQAPLPSAGCAEGGMETPGSEPRLCRGGGQVAEQLALWHLWGGRVLVPGPLCPGSPSPSLTASLEGSLDESRRQREAPSSAPGKASGRRG